jgi:hypothetical protein
MPILPSVCASVLGPTDPFDRFNSVTVSPPQHPPQYSLRQGHTVPDHGCHPWRGRPDPSRARRTAAMIEVLLSELFVLVFQNYLS